MQLVTRCGSIDEFVERFARFTSETELLVPALPDVAAGTAGRFVIRLKDQTTCMAGRCEVKEVLSVAVPTGGSRLLMRLGLGHMDSRSREVHQRMLEHRGLKPAPAGEPTKTEIQAPAPASAPPSSTAHTSQPLGRHATQAPPPAPPAPVPPAPGRRLFGAGDTVVDPPRAPGAAFTMRANPLDDVDAGDVASFVEVTRVDSETTDSAPIVIDAPSGPLFSWSPGMPGMPPDRRARARAIARRARPYAAGALGGLLLGLWIAHTPKPAATPTATPAPAAPPMPAAPPTPAAPQPSRVCEANVTSVPAGATVSWGEVDLGATPIAGAEVPCGQAVVTIRHEHYADAQQTIVAEQGKGLTLSERLRRPPATLIVTSSPPHARIKLNGKSFGATPARIDTVQFEPLRLEARLPGRRPKKRKLTLRQAETTIDITLRASAKARARSARKAH
jgi:hypothetical protein